MLSQLCTHPELRGLGLGTALVRALEHRCRQRELDVVRLAVEIANVRARTLYERLGYETFGEDVMGWEQPTASGVTWYKTTVTLMRRKL
jgi:ribosomal protein S18 acetylase RimI-like enzyme